MMLLQEFTMQELIDFMNNTKKDFVITIEFRDWDDSHAKEE